VASKCNADLLWERGPDGIIFRWGKGDVELHLSHREDNTPAIGQGVLVAHGLVENRAESRGEAALADLSEREAFSDVCKDVQVDL